MSKIEFKIKRFDGKNSYWQSYEVPVKRGMTVLEALFYIKEDFDPTLAFRASCRMGICGSCAVKINEKPRLACETQVLPLGKNFVKVEPLDNFRVLKDLITDFEGFFIKHKKVKPYLIREVDCNNPVELIQSPKEFEKYYIYTLCIKCGACYSVCPAAATRDNYLGPAAMAAAYRFCADSRDEGKKERILVLSDDGGVWRCHLAMECSEVCPKGVEPAKAVQMMRRSVAVEILKSLFRR